MNGRSKELLSWAAESFLHFRKKVIAQIGLPFPLASPSDLQMAKAALQCLCSKGKEESGCRIGGRPNAPLLLLLKQ
ncbi:hypothetical protein E2320_020633 [Naja naja]|nr:hypothetical protein E2320_020633 [Naja naja]